ncbi:MAG: DUF547 domain-containing protein [Planctomycetes bacterium]|nr:DUF547 domain-containing protein [Planctomycetota bacterium]
MKRTPLLILFVWVSAGVFFAGSCYAAAVDPNSSDDAGQVFGTDSSEKELRIVKGSIIEKYSKILAKYVDADGNVDYKTLRKKRIELSRLVKELDALHPAEMLSWSKEEKIAFWINAHNILTLKLVIDNYPIERKWYMIIYPDSSIMQIPGGRNKIYFKVMGLEYTLQEIEKGILLDAFQEPLISFGLSYGTMGGAYLLNEPYVAKKLYDQLNKQAAKMLTDKRGIRIDKDNKIVYLTTIFNNYRSQFIAKYGHIKRFRSRDEHIRSYLNCILEHVPADTEKYLINGDYVVKFQNYNWQLNEQTGK